MMVSVKSAQSSLEPGSPDLVSKSKWRIDPAWYLFAGAVLFGIVGAGLSRQHIEAAIAEHRARLVDHDSMLAVLVPVRPLSAGEILDRDLLAIRSIPARFVDSHTLTERELSETVGRELKYGIDAGRPLLQAHLSPEAPATFSDRVRSGMRALTVQVDEISSIAGLLQPGDRIDLLVSHDRSGERTIQPLIDKLPVVATGRDTDVAAADTGRRFHTITVEVDPQNARRIALAQQVGQLTAVLRNREDSAGVDPAPISIEALLGTVQTLPEHSGEPHQAITLSPVEYIIGGLK